MSKVSFNRPANKEWWRDLRSFSGERIAASCYEMGMLYWQGKRTRKALRYWNIGLRYSPHCAATHASLALAYRELGRLGAAMSHCTKAIENGYPTAAPFLLLAECLREKEEYSTERMVLFDALEHFPDDSRLCHALFLNHANADEKRNAVLYAEAAVLLEPLTFVYWRDYCEFNLRWNKYGQAIRCAGHMVNLRPRQATGYFYRAVAWLYLSKFEDSVRDLNAALAIDPTAEIVNRHLEAALHFHLQTIPSFQVSFEV
jgi:tetratricopeptide (TPR) repeat protein